MKIIQYHELDVFMVQGAAPRVTIAIRIAKLVNRGANTIEKYANAFKNLTFIFFPNSTSFIMA